uniref:Calcineurin-like phosphoesterase domain-containing protein n=1 Tax=Alexandrium catenella TaxID=2925 RepID=A0A7S1Q501_ALECA
MDQTYYIMSVNWGRLLNTHGSGVSLWNHGSVDVSAVVAAGDAPAEAGNVRWRLLECPHQSDVLYIVSDRHPAFLDTHGTDLKVWNNSGRDISSIIAGNTSSHAGNIRWRMLDCPHQPGVFYIVNVRHGTFLDADGGAVSLWNHGGKEAAAAIAENTSRYAANIRWHLLPVDRHADGGTPSPAVAPVRHEAPVQQPRPPLREVRIVHLSDTHAMHRDIEGQFPLPEGDVLVHTGDFSNHGTDAEIADFDAWLGEVGRRYPHTLVIPGNHDWWGALRQIEAGELSPQAAVRRGYMQSKLRNARVLSHEEVELFGVKIFGSPWSPWQKDGRPDRVGHHSPAYADALKAWQDVGGSEDVFSLIPPDVDVLMTHGPADAILDCLGTPGRGWGSSKRLREAIVRAKPRMHLFGHLHEQRGEYRRGTAGFSGGVEYTLHGKRFPTTGPPPADYPCELISCNAMCNHEGLDGTGRKSIAGPARLICVTPR